MANELYGKLLAWVGEKKIPEKGNASGDWVFQFCRLKSHPETMDLGLLLLDLNKSSHSGRKLKYEIMFCSSCM